jgi:hypothetical protein
METGVPVILGKGGREGEGGGECGWCDSDRKRRRRRRERRRRRKGRLVWQ